MLVELPGIEPTPKKMRLTCDNAEFWYVDLTLSLEVGPSEAEYGTTVGGGPVVGYGDAQCVYDKGGADQLMSVATELDLSPQAAVLGVFESDASHAKATVVSPRVGRFACRR
jgi:putative aminopeptidase FrvX